MDFHIKLSRNDFPKTKNEKEYMNIILNFNDIGLLMYDMIWTRPNITYDMSMVSRYMSNIDKTHLLEIKWVLRYIKGTKSIGLLFKCNFVNALVIQGYFYSDFA